MSSFDDNDVEQPLIDPESVSEPTSGNVVDGPEQEALVPVATFIQEEPTFVADASLYRPDKPNWNSKYISVGFALFTAIVFVVLLYSNSSSSGSNNDPESDTRMCPLTSNGWIAPAYANTSAFYEQCVDVTTQSTTNSNQRWTMSGALTVPHGTGPFPALLLMGGSGPTDMDGTAFEHNKAYKDLAWGLASRGVVVLRVNKRTFQFGPQAFPNNSAELFTFSDEYTNDALSALALLGGYDFVDAERLLLAGHSLGGEVAPHIAQLAGNVVKGLVLLAATPQSLPDLLPWQYYYLSNFSMYWGELAAQCRDLIQNDTLTPDWVVNCGAINPALVAFNMYGDYYLSGREYDPPTEKVAELVATTPVLLLQGTADYNVPYNMPSSIPSNNITDSVPTFQWWIEMFDDNPQVTLQVYDGLSHYFMTAADTVDGFATMTAEAARGNVDEAVVDDIVSWLTTTYTTRL